MNFSILLRTASHRLQGFFEVGILFYGNIASSPFFLRQISTPYKHNKVPKGQHIIKSITLLYRASTENRKTMERKFELQTKKFQLRNTRILNFNGFLFCSVHIMGLGKPIFGQCLHMLSIVWKRYLIGTSITCSHLRLSDQLCSSLLFVLLV